MGTEKILFYLFAALTVYGALMVITVRNPVKAALFLVFTFFTSAVIWLLMEAEFLAIVLVLVYVGAVMVLFLFVVMMLDINLAQLREGFVRYLPLGVAVAVAFAVMLIMLVGSDWFASTPVPAPAPAESNNTRDLGRLLYTVYVYPFEIAAVILLVAIVAAIALTLRRRTGVKYQTPGEQIAVRRRDRIRMIDMPPEEPK